MSAVSRTFHERFLSNPGDPGAFECRAAVFDGPEDYHGRIDDPALETDEHSILVLRGAGPVAWPGTAEAVDIRPPLHLVKQGVKMLPVLSEGRQGDASGAPFISDVSPEAAAGGNLAILVNGDRVRVDLNKRKVYLRLPDAEISNRRKRLKYAIPENQSCWQELYRQHVTQQDEGATFSEMTTFHDIRRKMPRHGTSARGKQITGNDLSTVVSGQP